MIFCPQRYNTKRRLSSVFRNFLSGCQSKGCVFRFYNCLCELLIFDAVFRRKARISPVNAVSATRSVERNLQRTQCVCEDAETSISLRIATKKILLLHRRTIAYEPRPNISPPSLRPRTPSAGRRRLHAPAHLRRACVFVRRHRYRALQTYGLRGRVPVLHLHPPRNCSLLTANC